MGQVIAYFVHNGISYVPEEDYKALGNRLVLKDFDLAALRDARDECVATIAELRGQISTLREEKEQWRLRCQNLFVAANDLLDMKHQDDTCWYVPDLEIQILHEVVEDSRAALEGEGADVRFEEGER
jgi:hypothetical protein